MTLSEEMQELYLCNYDSRDLNGHGNEYPEESERGLYSSWKDVSDELGLLITS